MTVEVSKIGAGSSNSNSNPSDEMGIVVVVERPTNTIDLMIAVLRRLREMGSLLFLWKPPQHMMIMIHHACNFEYLQPSSCKMK